MHMNVLETNEIETTSSASESRGTAKTLTVWLVDDRKDIRQLLAVLLEKQGGFRCACQFGDSDALLSFLSRHAPPDIILLDINLGSRNGLDALRTIKFVSPSTRVFILTTFWDPEHYVRALRDGASGFLVKSTEISDIARTLRRLDSAYPARFVTAPARPELSLAWWQRSIRFLSGVLSALLA
jgi:DNA-binding NarL/FixJ family response regulator